MACYLELIVKFCCLALLIDSLPISHAQDEDLLIKVALVPRNFTFAVLFSVHEASSNLYQPKCGPIQDQPGMQLAEAALWELKRINEEDQLKMYKHTFGLEIKDICGSYVYTFQRGLSIYNSVQNAPNNSIAGTVGPTFSAEIRITHEWISKHMPQIGFSATSPRMTDKKDKFKNFARLVQPKTHRARVIFDLINYFGQGCVNTIITAGVYGSGALMAFKEIIETTKTRENHTFCIGSQEIVYDDTTEDEMKRLLENSTQFSEMVVCFCEGRTLRKLYQIADQVKVKDQILFINSDGWTETDNMIDFQTDAIGSIMINTGPHQKTNPSENPWKEEFYQHRFKCSLNQSNQTQNCIGHEALEKNFFHDPKVPWVGYSIRAIAEAINHFVDDICCHSKEKCDKKFTMKNFEQLGFRFMNYSRDKNFEFGRNTSFRFNENDDPDISNYEVLSYANVSGYFTLHVIGSWTDVNGLVMNENLNHLFNKYKKIENRCNIQCPTGYYRATKSCCWTCTPCSSTSISNGNFTECKECDVCKMPNPGSNKGSVCVDKKNNLVIGKGEGYFSIFIALLGVLLTSYTAHVFYKHRRTPIVKLASIPLSFIIFCGMGLAHSTTMLNAVEPNAFTCTMLRFIPSISLTMIYGPILMKMNRISRALSATRKRFSTLRMKYLSATFLVTVSLLFVLADIILCTVVNMAITSKDEPNCRGPIKIVFCPQESLAQFNISHFVNSFLWVYCVLYAYISGQHLPVNFRETDAVIMSCLIAIVWWMFNLFNFAISSTDQDWPKRTLIMCVTLSITTLCNLMFMYFPKLYVILYRPKQNHRAFYSTATEMRCFFGTTESRCRGFSSVNIESTAGDPTMTTRQKTKKNYKNMKLEESKKQKNDTKSKLSNCKCLICTCNRTTSMSTQS